jgi:hypothetical protein
VFGKGTYNADGIKAIADAIAVSPSLACPVGGGTYRKPWFGSNCTRCKANKSEHTVKPSSLTSINLVANNLGPEGAKALAPAIRNSTSVTCLDVRNNSISGDGASQLSAAVLGNFKMEKFNTIPIKEMRTDSLTKLDLSGKRVEVVGGMVVAGLLPVMTSVTSVRAFRNS